jgi:hypothetical protein
MFHRCVFSIEADIEREIEEEEEGQMIFGREETRYCDFPFTLMLIPKILINYYKQVS